MDLSLVPMDDLVKEAEKRSLCFICSYTVIDPQEKETDWFHYGKGTRRQAVQLATDLQNDVLNNWNGELKALQRLNDEGFDG